MKKPTLWFIISSFIFHAGFSEIYVWEDYDDFSSGSLDSSKWDVWWGAGGELPIVVNGALKLSGTGNESDPASSVIPDDLTYTSNLPSKHSIALINQDDVYGVQAEFMIPSNPSDDTGLNFIFFDWATDGSKQEFGPELEYRSESGLRTEFAYTDPESGEDEQITRPAEFGTYYKMSLIHTDTTNSMYLNGELIKDFSSAGFEPDTIGFAAFNDDGLPYTTYVKNVRVLRRVATTNLDGSVLILSSADDVSETLSFENGTFTSTFQDPTEGTFVDTDKSYILDEVSSDVWKITLEDGDTYSFDASTNFGTLVDYENGVIDTEGTWSFTFERHDWEDYDDFSSGSLDSSKWDVWWGAGGALAVVENGALKLSGSGNESDPASSVIPDDLTYTSNLPSKHSIALINQDDVYGMQAEFMIPANPSDHTGLNFIFIDWATDGSKQAFGPELEYRAVSGLRTEFAYTDPESGEDEQITRPAEFGTYYKMSLIHADTTNSMYLNGELIKEFSSAGFEPDTIGFAAFNDDGLPYATYVKNVRVLRRSQETTEPDPVTVVSDPNGKPVVVQVGDEYQWNSTLDGVTLWLVGNDSGSIMHATIKYEASNYSGNFEFLDEVTDPIDTLSYAINENGYLAHTESLGQQYFQILSAEDGRIGTIGFMNDLSLANHSSEPANFFFTTRAAAEEYYYSKVNPKNWMWFDHYPWVYSEEEGDWLYFYPSGGTLMYWSNKGQAWRQFN